VRPAYYNENNKDAAATLRAMIAAKLIPAGDVDTRSIVDVGADDLVGYGQVHLFAGIGGWALAARLAGWPDDRELWSFSCPCQPFSPAGKRRGFEDPRHLSPEVIRLFRARRPARGVGEQVARKDGIVWSDRLRSDLEGIGYACRPLVIPACAVGAPHDRPRIFLATHPFGSEGQEQPRRREAGRVGRVEQPVSWDRSWEAAFAESRVLDDGHPRCSAATDAARNGLVITIAAEVIAAYADVYAEAA
jgi:DNA (cytosine-5)-methyltransferase 1